ncbi:sporulation protein YtxC [Paraliobacillus salinarum]|uniref:sporulation protein YtxC n=1 Tax=Paraliobacillus salinarum TaxID=1158996 RepID=UPI0015F4B798|nr:sporulation protein YtxC [Paraliobacillus salinarum]
MIQLLMSNEVDRMYFYRKLARERFICEVGEGEGGIITITSEKESSLRVKLARLLMEMWIIHSRKNTIVEMIKKHYYFEKEHDINTILELIFERALLWDGTINELEFQEKKKLLHIILLEMDDNTPLDYQACISRYDDLFHEIMISEIGYAIDEWKQEERYQHFIQSVRDYITNQPVKSDVLHIVQGKQFTFYREDGYTYSNEALKEKISEEPLYIVGLDENELNLTPILALAPYRIYIYGHDPSEAKTTAVRNIFQERVTYKRLQSFPFAHVE